MPGGISDSAYGTKVTIPCAGIGAAFGGVYFVCSVSKELSFMLLKDCRNNYSFGNVVDDGGAGLMAGIDGPEDLLQP